MKPTKEYKGRSTIRMFNTDCVEYMRQCNKRYNLAIVDPPYGNGTNADLGTGGYSKEIFKNKSNTWDTRPSGHYWTLLKTLTENQVVFGANFFPLPPSRGYVCWYKTDEVKGRDFSEFELVYTSFDEPARHVEEKPFIKKHERIHPTQKPVKLYKKLLRLKATEGDTIIDTHGGSMSIAIACWEEGFDLDIIEVDEDYFNNAVTRFENHIKQGVLF